MSDKPRGVYEIKETIIAYARGVASVNPLGRSDLVLLINELDTYRERYNAWKAAQPRILLHGYRWNAGPFAEDADTVDEAVHDAFYLDELEMGTYDNISVDSTIVLDEAAITRRIKELGLLEQYRTSWGLQ